MTDDATSSSEGHLTDEELAEHERPDLYELRELGIRVLDDDQCCELGCSGGACESCPCCCAGWCLNGGTEIPDPGNDQEAYDVWLADAAERNPVAARLAAVEAAVRDRDAALQRVRELHKPKTTMRGSYCSTCRPPLTWPCATVAALDGPVG